MHAKRMQGTPVFVPQMLEMGHLGTQCHDHQRDWQSLVAGLSKYHEQRDAAVRGPNVSKSRHNRSKSPLRQLKAAKGDATLPHAPTEVACSLWGNQWLQIEWLQSCSVLFSLLDRQAPRWRIIDMCTFTTTPPLR